MHNFISEKAKKIAEMKIPGPVASTKTLEMLYVENQNHSHKLRWFAIYSIVILQFT